MNEIHTHLYYGHIGGNIPAKMQCALSRRNIRFDTSGTKTKVSVYKRVEQYLVNKGKKTTKIINCLVSCDAREAQGSSTAPLI